MKNLFFYKGVILLAHLTTAMNLQQELLILCPAMYSHNTMMCIFCLQAKNVFDLVKRTVIGFEEIVFQVFINHYRL